jgi:drug/metabolite transporter (DMT)-like permease
MLVGRIGPERAAYCTVLFPIVALAVSTVFEGYRWSALAALGLMLVVAGNLVAFDLTRRLAAWRGSERRAFGR